METLQCPVPVLSPCWSRPPWENLQRPGPALSPCRSRPPRETLQRPGLVGSPCRSRPPWETLQCPGPVRSPCRSRPPRETLQCWRVVLVQSPVGSLLLSSESWCTENFVVPSKGESLFHPVLWKSCNQIPVASRSDSWGLPVSLLGPRAGSLVWGSGPSRQRESVFGITVLQSEGHPPGGCGI